jgi:hypothetical protein
LPALRLNARYGDRAVDRRLPGMLTLRDVADVEARVTETLEALRLSLDAADFDALVLDAIGIAGRIERALPPDQALEPVLQAVLDDRLRSRATKLRRAA